MYENKHYGFLGALASNADHTQSALGQPVRAPEIHGQLELMAMQMKEAHDLLDRFEAKLGRVMRSEPPTTANGAAPQSVASCEMGAALRSLNDDMERANARMRYMLDRLEICPMGIEAIRFSVGEGGKVILQVCEREADEYEYSTGYRRPAKWRDGKVEDLLQVAQYVRAFDALDSTIRGLQSVVESLQNTASGVLDQNQRLMDEKFMRAK